MSFIKKRINGLIIAISGMFFLLKNEDSIKVQSLFFLLFIFLGYYFEITKKIADLGFGEKDIHGITTDEEVYVKYEKWRKDNNI